MVATVSAECGLRANGGNRTSDSGGLAFCTSVSFPDFSCSRGSLTPVAAPNVSPNEFFEKGPGYGIRKSAFVYCF